MQSQLTLILLVHLRSNQGRAYPAFACCVDRVIEKFCFFVVNTEIERNDVSIQLSCFGNVNSKGNFSLWPSSIWIVITESNHKL